jgi:FtsK/SpoIIIE family
VAQSFSMQGLWFLPSLIFGAVQGFTTGSWQMLTFGLVSLSIWPLGKWLKNHRDFQLAGPVVFDGKDVWIGDHRLPRREIFWRKSWQQYLWDGFASQRNRVQLPEKLEVAKARGYSGERHGSNWLGLGAEGTVDFEIATDGPHLLIVGATGTGKSELLRLLVSGWLNRQVAIDMALIDFKGGATLARFAGHPWVIGLATDLQSTGALKIAETFESQLAERQKLLASLRCSAIEEFWNRGGVMKRQIIVIDELGELLRQHPRLAQALEQVAARGRSLGMHLVVTNQSMSGIARGLLVNLRARVAIGDMDPIDFSQLGFRGRIQPKQSLAEWRWARLRNASGFEVEFEFPIGF